jgi:hypothetical protein
MKLTAACQGHSGNSSVRNAACGTVILRHGRVQSEHVFTVEGNMKQNLLPKQHSFYTKFGNKPYAPSQNNHFLCKTVA